MGIPSDYVDILSNTHPGNPGAMMDRRISMIFQRPLKGGHPTFHHIVLGIDKALKQDLTVNFRMVLDKQNIYDLPELARFCYR